MKIIINHALYRQRQSRHTELDKSQSSLHKAFYNGGVVDIPQEYPSPHHQDSVILLQDGTTKVSVKETHSMVETALHKPPPPCKGCIRR